MEYSGAGEKLIHEKKNRSKKSRDTVPLMVLQTSDTLLTRNGFVLIRGCRLYKLTTESPAPNTRREVEFLDKIRTKEFTSSVIELSV